VLSLCLAHHSYEVWFYVIFTFFLLVCCFPVGLYLFMDYIVELFFFLLSALIGVSG
jgi:hypothetical protein